MSDARTIFDPFLGKDVVIVDRLTDRLRGNHACGPHMPNGRPEFGFRQFQAPPIQHEAAAVLDALVEALRPFAWYFEVNDCNDMHGSDALEVPVKDLRAAAKMFEALGLPIKPIRDAVGASPARGADVDK